MSFVLFPLSIASVVLLVGQYESWQLVYVDVPRVGSSFKERIPYQFADRSGAKRFGFDYIGKGNWDAVVHLRDGGSITLEHEDYINSVEFSPDGNRIVTSSDDATAKVWRSKDGTLIATLRGHIKSVVYAGFTSNGELIVTIGHDKTDGTIRVWRQCRPEDWWGIFYLYQFWLSICLTGLFVHSIIRDRAILASYAKTHRVAEQEMKGPAKKVEK